LLRFSPQSQRMRVRKVPRTSNHQQLQQMRSLRERNQQELLKGMVMKRKPKRKMLRVVLFYQKLRSQVTKTKYMMSTMTYHNRFRNTIKFRIYSRRTKSHTMRSASRIL